MTLRRLGIGSLVRESGIETLPTPMALARSLVPGYYRLASEHERTILEDFVRFRGSFFFRRQAKENLDKMATRPFRLHCNVPTDWEARFSSTVSAIARIAVARGFSFLKLFANSIERSSSSFASARRTTRSPRSSTF